MADDITPTPESDDEATEAPAAEEAGDAGTEDNGGESTEAPPAASTTTVPEDLAPLEDAGLRDLHETLEAEYAAAREAASTPADVEALRGIRDQQGRIRAELEARVAMAADLADLDAGAAELPAPEPVTAAAVARQRTRPNTAPPPSAQARPAVDWLDAEGEPTTFEQMGLVANEAARAGSRRTVIASIQGFDATEGIDRDAMLSHDSTYGNDRRIREAVEDWRVENDPAHAPRTAAICDPLDIIREIPDCSSAAEPVSAIWPSRPAGRLGFTYTPSIGLPAVLPGTANWDEADQAGVDPDDPATWKPCLDIDCPTPAEVRAEAVTACFRFDNTTEMSNPERIRNVLNTIMAAKARRKEGRQLAIIDAQSIADFGVLNYAAPFGGGTIPTLIDVIEKLKAQTTWDNRNGAIAWTLILPPGVRASAIADMSYKAFGPDCEACDVIDHIARTTGVRVVETLDTADGLSPFAPLTPPGPNTPGLPNVYPIRLVAPEAAIYAETGDLYVGIERDPDLLRQNRAQWFAEEYWMLAKHGCEPWISANVTLCENGARTGFNAPVAC